ncbi:MAG: thiamine diphosphokinase [Pseudomonadota bacterium]
MTAEPDPVLRTEEPVLLVGAGPIQGEDLSEITELVGPLIAADGGAAKLIDAGLMPDAVIGDMDSLLPEMLERLCASQLFPVAEQDSTDFEKCLTRIDAPLIFALGFTAGRMDHLLAVLNTMIRHPDRRCLLVGPEDVGLVLPPRLKLLLAPDTPVSLFPMRDVTVDDIGLTWPLTGLSFRPDGQIGTSNRATGPVTLVASGPGMLLFLPRKELAHLLEALHVAPKWDRPWPS